MPSPKLAFKERRKPAPKGQEEASETQTTRAGLVPGPRKELPRLGTKRTRSSVERWAKGVAERKPALPRRTLGKLRLWVEPVPHRWYPQTCGRSKLEPSPGLKDAVGVGGWRDPGHWGREGDAAAEASAQMGRRDSEVCWCHGRGSEGEVHSEQVPWAPRGDDVLGAPPPKEQWRKRRGLPRRKMGCLTGTEACRGRKRSLRRRLPPGMWAAAQSQGLGGSSSPSSGRRERPGWRPG